MSNIFFTLLNIDCAPIPSISCSLVFGLTSLLTYSFDSCHKFSIGLRSGDSAGVFHLSLRWIVLRALMYASDHCLAWIYGHQGILLQGRIEAYCLISWYIKVLSSFLQKCRLLYCLASLSQPKHGLSVDVLALDVCVCIHVGRDSINLTKLQLHMGKLVSSVEEYQLENKL